MKKFFKILSLSLPLAILTTGIEANAYAQSNQQVSTPTIFIHDWGSSDRAEDNMVKAATKAEVTHTVIRANVSRKGKVMLSKSLPKEAKNPIIKVNMQNNKLSTSEDQKGGNYIKNVVRKLEQQQHYKTINFVGHSMGNLEIVNYIRDNVHNSQLPRVNHYVAIAGCFDGSMKSSVGKTVKVNSKTGKPNKMTDQYKRLLPLRKTFPTNAAVLNIYGNVKDGSKSDEVCPVNSAKSLKYLVGKRAKSYKELGLSGKQAQHSHLHHNKTVNRALIRFIWNK